MTAPDIPALRKLMEKIAVNPCECCLLWCPKCGLREKLKTDSIAALPALLAAAEETEKRDQKWMDGIESVVGFKIDWSPGIGPFSREVPPPSFADAWTALKTRAETAEAKLAEAEEVARMRDAAISVIALCNTHKALDEQSIPRENPYWTVGYSDVQTAVKREIKERERAETAEAKLAEAEKQRDLAFRQYDSAQETIDSLTLHESERVVAAEARAERMEALVRQMREHESGGYDVLASQIKDELYAAPPESAPCATHAYRYCDFCRPEGVPFVPPSPAKCATCGGSGVTSAPYELDAEDCPACGGGKS